MSYELTEKENYQLLMSGQQPEWVPCMSMAPGSVSATAIVFPELLAASIQKPGKCQDIFGVTYVPCEDANGAKVPEVNNYILKDIRQWRDVIKVPDISGIDWEAMAKRDFAFFHADPEKSLISWGSHFGFFQYLMAFMGYNEGLCALYEEPEEVRELLEYLCDFFLKVMEASVDYYKPDIIDMCDDIASWKNPFISREMYREIIKPVTARQAKFANDRGIPISMHCCGHCEELIDDWRDFGVKIWNPAQTCNDLPAIKKKYGNSLIIVGGWDGRDELLSPDVTREQIEESIIKTIDTMAPGGGYAFAGGFLGTGNDEITKKKNQWVREIAVPYCKNFYKK